MPKEFLTYQQQMEKLRSSGLRIEDEDVRCIWRVPEQVSRRPLLRGFEEREARSPEAAKHA